MTETKIKDALIQFHEEDLRKKLDSQRKELEKYLEGLEVG